MRLIRNYLERARAEPLLFRLKFLDDRSKAVPVLLKAEIRARQFFLLCDSRNSRASYYVQEERRYVDGLQNKSKYTIDLDHTPWVTPKSAIDALLRHASIVVAYTWKDQKRVSKWIRDLTTVGASRLVSLSDGSPSEEGEIAYQAYATDLEEPQEPTTIDNGIIGLDDRTSRDSTWVQAAISAARRADTIVLCVARSNVETAVPLDFIVGQPRNPGELALCPHEASAVRKAYGNAYVLDPDSVIEERKIAVLLETAGWKVLAGSLEEQLSQLVVELRNQNRSWIAAPEAP